MHALYQMNIHHHYTNEKLIFYNECRLHDAVPNAIVRNCHVHALRKNKQFAKGGFPLGIAHTARFW